MTNNKEIIGYKAPFNINAIVLKGTIYTKCDSKNYCPKDKHHKGSEWYLPPQIVETWEPVYKEEPIPEYVECISWTGNVCISGKVYKISELNKYIDPFKHHKHCFKPSTKEAYDLQHLPKFEVGKWYRYNEGGGWALKCCRNSNDKLEWSSYIKFSTKEFYKCAEGTTFNYTINNMYITNIEIPLSEIQQYLPDGHPDKIVKEKDLFSKAQLEVINKMIDNKIKELQ